MDGTVDVEGSTYGPDADSKPRTFKEHVKRTIRILLPHIGLTTILLGYISMGAAVFQTLEASEDVKVRTRQLSALSELYTRIMSETWARCKTIDHHLNPLSSIPLQHLAATTSTSSLIVNNSLRRSHWDAFIKAQLLNLSQIHDADPGSVAAIEAMLSPNPSNATAITDASSPLQTRWTFHAAVLYALTVLTTTGYDHVTPKTAGGKLFAVFFGLVGIPLMFITAADIGKFLSEFFMRCWAHFVVFRRHMWRRIKRHLCCCFRHIRKTEAAAALKTIRTHKKPPTMNNANNDTNNNSNPHKDSVSATTAITRVTSDQKDGGLTQNNVGNSRRNSEDKTEQPTPESDDSSENDPVSHIELPIFAYFGLILSYCAIGGLLYTSWETDSYWTFLHAFHFSFNTITTIGLGNIVVKHVVYMFLIVAYVIIGLAVVTMCVDLASSQLKMLFSKIHYFGRKIRTARTAIIHMSDDLREALRVVAAIRKHKPAAGPGAQITAADIRKYLEAEAAKMASGELYERPFIPDNIHFIKFVDEDRRKSRQQPIEEFCTVSDRSSVISNSVLSITIPRTVAEPNSHI